VTKVWHQLGLNLILGLLMVNLDPFWNHLVLQLVVSYDVVDLTILLRKKPWSLTYFQNLDVIFQHDEYFGQIDVMVVLIGTKVGFLDHNHVDHHVLE
jgi:hypothetical protein